MVSATPAGESKTSAEEVAAALLRVRAVRVSLGKPFVYASGALSPIYTNCRGLSSHPKEMEALLGFLCQSASATSGAFDLVASAGTASLPLTSLLAQRLRVPMVFVRLRAKSHGMKKQIEGELKPGARVLLLSDILSTEEDIPRSIEALESAGGRVVRCLALFDNHMGVVDSYLQNRGIPFSSLSDVSTLVEVGMRSGYFSPEEQAALKEWASNPLSWKGRQEETARSLEASRRRVAELLLDIGAVKINKEAPFRYTSGILSPIYTDCRLFVSHPKEWEGIIEAFVAVLKDKIGTRALDALGGTAVSGIPHATRVARELGVPMVYISIRGEGERETERIEGELKAEDRVVIIEDHVTTGSSVLKTAAALRRKGAVVEACVAIFTYDLEASRQALARENIQLETLCDLSVLIDVAMRIRRITEGDKNAVLEWVKNPQFWGADRKPRPSL